MSAPSECTHRCAAHYDGAAPKGSSDCMRIYRADRDVFTGSFVASAYIVDKPKDYIRVAVASFHAFQRIFKMLCSVTIANDPFEKIHFLLHKFC